MRIGSLFQALLRSTGAGAGAGAVISQQTKATHHILVNLVDDSLGGEHAVFLAGDDDLIALRGRWRDVHARTGLRLDGGHALAVRPLDERVVDLRDRYALQGFA